VKRPLFSALTSTTLSAAGIDPPPPWEVGLDDYLRGRATRRSAALT